MVWGTWCGCPRVMKNTVNHFIHFVTTRNIRHFEATGIEFVNPWDPNRMTDNGRASMGAHGRTWMLYYALWVDRLHRL